MENDYVRHENVCKNAFFFSAAYRSFFHDSQIKIQNILYECVNPGREFYTKRCEVFCDFFSVKSKKLLADACLNGFEGSSLVEIYS